MGTLYITEHDAERAMPPLEAHHLHFDDASVSSKVLYPGTKAVRLMSDTDCWISFGDPESWHTRLSSDVPEWFTMKSGHRNVQIWVKAEPDE